MRRRDPSHPLLEKWIRGSYRTEWNQDLPGIAQTNDDGTSRSWHATDDPDRVLRALRSRRLNFIASYGPRGKHAELGPGFYVGNPHIWSSRSTQKWAFLTTLDREQYARLASYLRAALHRDRVVGHITERELARAEDALEHGFDNYPHLVGTLANQPYNIAFWKPEILNPLGIQGSSIPSILQIDFRGHFAELAGSYPPPTILRLLRREGFQGVYTRASMGTNAELALWDPRAIVEAHLDEDILA